MLDGTFSTKYSEDAIRAEHDERRRDMKYQNELAWKFFLKFLAVCTIIIMILFALD